MTKFRHSVKKNKRLYGIYNGIKKRCHNSKEPRYKDYGGRGIVMCDEWLNSEDGFDKFVDWSLANGYDSDLSIDRIDVNGNYCPENCRWTTMKEQRRNCRDTRWVEYKGERIQLISLCEKLGVSYDTVHDRIYKRGWSLEDALIKPSMQYNSFAKRCKEHGIKASVVRDRIVKLGWTEEEALNTPSAGRIGGTALGNARRKNRICKVCGESFKPTNSKQIYCGEKCRSISKRVSYRKNLAIV